MDRFAISGLGATMFLLIPLFILWVRSPMHFSKTLRTIAQVAIFSVCMTVPPTSQSVAGEGYGDTPPLVPTLGRADATVDASSPTDSEARHFREGTLVEGITGRFAMVGRRWAFIPDRPLDLSRTAAGSAGAVEPESSKTTTVNSTIFGARTPSGKSVAVVTSTTRTKNHLLKQYQSLDTPITSADLPQLLVSENLMLQRVVDAVRADQADSQWTVSGEIKEFFDENVLLLKTVKRTATKHAN